MPVAAADRKDATIEEQETLLGRGAPADSDANGYTTFGNHPNAYDGDEESSRPSNQDDEKVDEHAAIWTVFPVLLTGVFLANADSSIVLATNQHIASEFNALSSAAWLLTSYTMAQCASQPLYGRLSDVFGRKKNLAFCWIAFALGCLLIGIGRTYWQVLVGRAVSGIGSAGMIALTSIVVTDLLPLRKVATFRAYINLTATSARSIGGPIGGWLAVSIGWRWCFIAQAPLALCGLGLVLWRLPSNNRPNTSAEDEELDSTPKKLRVDYFGAVALVGTILSGLLALDLAGKRLHWYLLTPVFAAFVAFLALFITIERRFGEDAMLPLALISKRDVLTSYLIVAFQASAQFGLLYGIPIYFQAVAGLSVPEAGTRIVPVVLGNATGTLISGIIVNRTRRYKRLTLFGNTISFVCFLLMFIRWRGTTSWFDSAYVYLAGFGMGTIQSTTFVHLVASLDHSEVAIAGTSWFLAQSLGSLVGASMVTPLLNSGVRASLRDNLPDGDDRAAIIKLITSSLESIRLLPKNIQKIASEAYITSLLHSDLLSMVLLSFAFCVTIMVKERPFTRP